MKEKKLINKLISTILALSIVLASNAFNTPLQVRAASPKDISSSYLNATVKYLHLGNNNKFNFNVKKTSIKKGATYSWYINTKKGNSKAVKIDKKTGVVTAVEAGTAYIGCKITLSGGKVVKPEARVTVRNNITNVDISNLPADNTVAICNTMDFNSGILNTEGGKSKATQGVIRWEVAEDTAGIGTVSDEGEVFPGQAGSFKIRAVCFQSKDKYISWLTNKKGNAKYITASSKWYTITSESMNGQSVVRTQDQLDKALKSDSITESTIATDASLTFRIAKGDYTSKKLIVNAPNADVENYGNFKDITIKAIKDSTFIEYADGNIVYLSDSQLRIIIEKDAHVKRIVFDTEDTVADVIINGSVDLITFTKPAEANITGSAKNISLTVDSTAGGSIINSSIAINAALDANADISLNSGADGSVIDRSTADIKIDINNQTKESVVLTTNHMNQEAIPVGENTIGNDAPTEPTTPTEPTDPPAPAKPNVISVQAIPDITVASGISQDALGLPALVSVALSNNTSISLAVVWESSDYNKDASGSYTFHGTLSLNDNIINSSNIKASAIVSVDKSAPVLDPVTGVTLSDDWKTATVTFNEPIVNNLDSLDLLKSSILLTKDGKVTTFTLADGDTLAIQENKLILTFVQAVTYENLQIIIAGNSLKDIYGNTAAEDFTTNALIKSNDTRDTATPITVDSAEMKYWIDPEGDVDWYSFEAAQGDKFNIKLNGYSEFGTVIGVYNSDDVSLYESTYLVLSNEVDKLNYIDSYFVAPEAGTYYVKVINNNGVTVLYNNMGTWYTNTTGCYGLQITKAPQLLAAEPNDTAEQAASVTANSGAMTNYIYPDNDTDWFKIEMQQGTTYDIRTTNLSPSDTMDTVMYLYEASDTQVYIAENDDNYNRDDNGLSSEIVYTATATGTYYINIVHFDNGSTIKVGRYDLVLTTVDIEALVAAAEAAGAADPLNAMTALNDAYAMVFRLSDSDTSKSGYLNRLDAVGNAIEQAFFDLVNTSYNATTVQFIMKELNLPNYSQLSTAKQEDIANMFIKVYPEHMFSNPNDLGVALMDNYNNYQYIIENINSATDQMAIQELFTYVVTPYYGITIAQPEDFSQSILNQRPAGGYALLSDILGKLEPVTYSAVLRSVSGSAITMTPVSPVGIISASVDGTAIPSGAYVEKGKTVIFELDPTSAGTYDIYYWRVTGDYDNSGTTGIEAAPDVFPEGKVTFTSLTTPADVTVEVTLLPQ